ncbi:MAG: thioredoxin family protein [Actinobacteria bacterium]|nr:thioredoxin family protein [Actinomycetota bacterium]
MAATSTMLPLGTPAPDLDLPDLDGHTIGREDLDGDALLVMFLCNHCPYVRHIEGELGELVADYQARGLDAVAVCSNDPEQYPDDDRDGLREQVRRAGFTFPYLIDEEQQVGRAYRAACTPDFFLFDGEHRLVWRGRMDASTPGNDVPVTGEELRAALDAVLAGEPAPEEQHPSMGCSIKWKPGTQPAGDLPIA